MGIWRSSASWPGCGKPPVAVQPMPTPAPVLHVQHPTVPPPTLPPLPVSPPQKTATLVADWSVPVLMYHRVADLSAKERTDRIMRDLAVPPAMFEQQLQYLDTHGFTVLSLEELREAIALRTPLPLKAVAFTFDDGYEDNYTQAYPLLKKHQMPATVFVVMDTMGTQGHLTWEEASEMAAHGVSIGSHTISHPDLEKLAPEKVKMELRKSREALMQHLTSPALQLAYPSGDYNADTMLAARDAGYTAAWRVGGGPVTPSADLMQLPRIRISGTGSLKRFANTVENPSRSRKKQSIQA
jgi:peptidoglycan/xylan/chitin deacetylase (PgdA/CDA1 family)